MNNAGQVQERALFVSWRDPNVGSIHPIGRLVRRIEGERERYSFGYLKLAEGLEGFEPLPGLPDLHLRYDRDRLFPVFANRIMPRSRPDYDLLAAHVDLRGDADPFEVLARTGGRRATDRIEVFAGPERTPEGDSSVLFFARGLRRVEGAPAAVSSLEPDDRLVLVDDPQNPYNPRAVLLRISDGREVGWVPDYLVDHVHELRELNRSEPVVVVEHVNDETVAPHMRLLCRLRAPWPDGYVPFSGPDFQTLVDLS
ncbi:MAG: HIRAN domain-containing protein [Acidimicrobiales bacterium]